MFSGKRYRIHFEYGLFCSLCRRQELADLMILDIFGEENDALPGAQSHPYTIFSFSDLRRALETVIKKRTGSAHQ